MAGPILGMTGSVVWANGTTGTNNAQLTSNAVTGGNPVSFDVFGDADEYDTTAFSTTDPTTTFLKGLTSWRIEFEALLPGPEIGALGLLTFAAGYTANLNEWEITVERPAIEVTAFGATEKAFLPGLYGWMTRFGGYLDDTTAAAMVANSSEPATATFKYSERGATDATLSGSMFTKGLRIGSRPADVGKISYDGRGSGALTHSTPTSGNSILTAGAAITHDSAGTITATASTGRTYAGSAFWTRLSIGVGVNRLMTVRVTAHGTGALTIS